MGYEAAFIVGAGAILGGATGFFTAYSQAEAQEAAADFQSRLAARNARQEQLYATLARNQANAAAQATENQTDAEAQRLRRKNAFAMSENRSLLGASGLQNSGSNLLFEIDNAVTASMDVQNTIINGRYQAELQRYEGEVNAYKHESQAANFTAQSKYYRSAANAAYAQKWWGGTLGGLSGAFSGAAAGASMAGGFAELGLIGGAGAGAGA